MIETYLQGVKDRTLFGLIGALIVSPAIHKLLGAPVSGEPGDTWLVATSEDGTVNGFAQMRLNKGDSAHIRYVYGADAPTRLALARGLIAAARENGSELVFTNDRMTAAMWGQLGFEQVGTKRKTGEFVRWEKTL